MNFNYSYRAFLISSLLIGNLILLLVSIKLNNYKEVEEESFNVEYSDDLLEEEEQEFIELIPASNKIETHRAFNEAEKFIAESEEELSKLSEATEAKIAEMNEALKQNNSPLDMKSGLSDSEVNNVKEKKEKAKTGGGANRKSTNSYYLEGRQTLYFPNPVYTCEGYGTVVINIEVSATGRVVKAQFDDALSGTRNLCLVDNALNYARKSRFTTDSSREKQRGTITYLFPGQD